MEILIRKLTAGDDLKQVTDLCMKFFSEYESHHNDFFDTDNLRHADISGRFIESTKSDNSITYIAVTDNSIVGYILAAIRDQPHFYKTKKVGTISGLMVAKEFRRRGVGRKLLSEIKSYFEKNSIKYYTVYTAVNNREALEFYKKNNMRELQTTLLGETKAQPDTPADSQGGASGQT